ncbi:hypothetical protein PR048_024610 [Dryococelus australis]|uniref:Uncharacterized protein n=1 Tax=Dryococelus australis TaxID=614101 RepID=A0ABQ9GP24_9NEOP|nr:hypothetical protein PR048_024610 [Dryococelus australis]
MFARFRRHHRRSVLENMSLNLIGPHNQFPHADRTVSGSRSATGFREILHWPQFSLRNFGPDEGTAAFLGRDDLTVEMESCACTPAPRICEVKRLSGVQSGDCFTLKGGTSTDSIAPYTLLQFQSMVGGWVAQHHSRCISIAVVVHHCFRGPVIQMRFIWSSTGMKLYGKAGVARDKPPVKDNVRHVPAHSSHTVCDLVYGGETGPSCNSDVVCPQTKDEVDRLSSSAHVPITDLTHTNTTVNVIWSTLMNEVYKHIKALLYMKGVLTSNCLPPMRSEFDSRRGRSRILPCGNRAGRCRWSVVFLGDLSFPPPLHSGGVSYPASLRLLGYCHAPASHWLLVFKSGQNLSTPLSTSFMKVLVVGKQSKMGHIKSAYCATRTHIPRSASRVRDDIPGHVDGRGPWWGEGVKCGKGERVHPWAASRIDAGSRAGTRVNDLRLWQGSRELGPRETRVVHPQITSSPAPREITVCQVQEHVVNSKLDVSVPFHQPPSHNARVKRDVKGAVPECRGKRENPPISGIVRHDSHLRESSSGPAGNRARFGLVGGERSGRYATTAPFPSAQPCVGSRADVRGVDVVIPGSRRVRENRRLILAAARTDLYRGLAGSTTAVVVWTAIESPHPRRGSICTCAHAPSGEPQGGRYTLLQSLTWRDAATYCDTGDAVELRIQWSPTNKANRVRFPVGIFARENPAGRCRCSGGFQGALPFTPPLYSGAAPYSPRFTFIGSQDLDGGEGVASLTCRYQMEDNWLDKNPPRGLYYLRAEEFAPVMMSGRSHISSSSLNAQSSVLRGAAVAERLDCSHSHKGEPGSIRRPGRSLESPARFCCSTRALQSINAAIQIMGKPV